MLLKASLQGMQGILMQVMHHTVVLFALSLCHSSLVVVGTRHHAQNRSCAELTLA